MSEEESEGGGGGGGGGGCDRYALCAGDGQLLVETLKESKLDVAQAFFEHKMALF